MNERHLRKELALFLKREYPHIVKIWVNQIFKTPSYQRLKDIIPKRVYIAGMSKYLNALISDIENPSSLLSNKITEELALKDELSANRVEDTLHGLISLREVIAKRLEHIYKNDVDRYKDHIHLIITSIEKSILCFSKVYKKKDFNRLKALMRYGKRMMGMHNLDKLCHLILKAAVEESSAERASLMLLKKEGYLYIKSSIGIPKNIIASTTQKLGKGISGIVAKTGKPLIINKGEQMQSVIKKSLRGLGLASAVSIPIVSQKKIIGVLNLGKYSRKPFFDEEDVELLFILAYEAGTAIDNCQLFEELENYYMGSIVSLVTAIETRDRYTNGHSTRVTKFATNIARRLKLSNIQIENIRCASILHDIGKIGIPDNILHKPGRLTRREYSVIKKHPVYGVNILKYIPRLRLIIPIIYHEHERYDGKGYIDGLKGKEIPIESRIISVADAYEAMTSNRPYRKALGKKAAIDELKRCSGTQFDPEVVGVFLRLLKKR